MTNSKASKMVGWDVVHIQNGARSGVRILSLDADGISAHVVGLGNIAGARYQAKIAELHHG